MPNNRKPLHSKPFLKWAGGKSQLVSQIERFLPSEVKKGRISSYVEPFIGGGAVFFHLQSRFKFNRVVLCDQNQDLILTYQTLRDFPELLMKDLKKRQQQYLSFDQQGREKLFYHTRDQFNQIASKNLSGKQMVQRAGMFVFLNKTCFNGLFRLNSKGKFNVPLGRYKNPCIYDPIKLQSASELLQKVELLHADYRQVKKRIGPSTFVYFDPPYRPLNTTANFTSYTAQCFGDDEQSALAEFFRYCHKKKAKLMLSNSDPKNFNPRDEFFDQLYKGFTIRRIPARRYINSRADRRGAVNELLITNYD